jgi:hypothetical protein
VGVAAVAAKKSGGSFKRANAVADASNPLRKRKRQKRVKIQGDGEGGSKQGGSG